MLGPVDLLFGGKPSVAKGLNVVFDSGSTYTYLNPKAYQAVLSMVSCLTKKSSPFYLFEKPRKHIHFILVVVAVFDMYCTHRVHHMAYLTFLILNSLLDTLGTRLGHIFMVHVRETACCTV